MWTFRWSIGIFSASQDSSLVGDKSIVEQFFVWFNSFRLYWGENDRIGILIWDFISLWGVSVSWFLSCKALGDSKRAFLKTTTELFSSLNVMTYYNITS